MPLLHALRRMVLPESKNRINPDWTFEEVFDLTIKVAGIVFVVGGTLIAANKRVIGGLICLLAMVFVIALQDNPLLIEFIKPKPKSDKIRYDDLARHISLIGAILFFMAVDPVDDAVVEDEKKSKKAKKNN